MSKIISIENNNRRVAITLGDPAGIGMEVILKALASKDLPTNINPILIGCRKSLNQVYQLLSTGSQFPLANPDKLDIEDIPIAGPLKPGNPTIHSGDASFKWLTRGVQLVLNNHARALITGPIAKQNWKKAGHHYPGQTERLAELTNSNHAAMLFTGLSPISGWRLNTLLATTHIPLSKVSDQITPELIKLKLKILTKFCKRSNSNPKITVAGLNPHSGEDGQFGNEEIQWLTPLLKQWQREHPDINLEGPISPDTCWISAAKAWQGNQNTHAPDGILALYHDQGLIPVKLIAFEDAVNTTLGLPFIRTSPDHGTAFDIAGKGLANAGSMVAAIKTAWELSAT